MQILIIDDEPDIMENISEILSFSGYEILSATDGKTGIVTAKEQLPDLILCDLMLPELDGYAVLRELRSHEHLVSTPIIIMSGKADQNTITTILEQGATEFLQKPFDTSTLLTTIKQYRHKDAS